MPKSTIRVADDGGIATVTIDRPPANALDDTTLLALGDALERLHGDPPRALVLTGAGDRFFSAGGDVKELAALDTAGGVARVHAFQRVLALLEAMPWPVACAVNGTAVGGGTELVLFCDHTTAAAGARLGLPEINHGLLPSAMTAARALRRLGEPVARRLMLSGELVTAARAAELGLVDEVVDTPGDAHAGALEWARAMAAKPPVLVAAVKDLLRDGRAPGETRAEMSVRQFLDYFGDPATIAAREAVVARWRARR